jgi:sulfur carrier protein
MQVIVNSAPMELPPGVTVAGLLERLQVPRTRVAVEVNRLIVRRAQHPETVLNEGDEIEVVTLVGGG